MIPEIQKILQEGMDKEVVEPFDDGSYQVDMDTLQKIYVAGHIDGTQFHGDKNNG